jgi:hypothetical protein
MYEFFHLCESLKVHSKDTIESGRRPNAPDGCDPTLIIRNPSRITCTACPLWPCSYKTRRSTATSISSLIE